MEPGYLRTILGEDKIRLLMDGKRREGGVEVSAEPVLLTPDAWDDLRSVWQRMSLDLFSRNGRDHHYHQAVLGDERLQCAINRVFEGYMRALAYQLLADLDNAYDVPAEQKEEAEQQLAAHRANATYDLELYTQYATEYLQRKGGINETGAKEVVGSIITRSIGTFCSCKTFRTYYETFPQKIPEIHPSSWEAPEYQYPAGQLECAEEPRSLRHLRQQGKPSAIQRQCPEEDWQDRFPRMRARDNPESPPERD